MSTSNTKRIAKNTLLLYFRMLLIMFTNLFIVRLVLDILGVVDYGIYNVVGGVVVMFSFLSDTMASSTQRFFSYELGKNDFNKLNNLFSITVIIYAAIIIIILLTAETVGLWFLNNKMTIPEDRLTTANWVYQFSILTFFLNILKTPYTSIIIAHERMNIFAYLSIVESLKHGGINNLNICQSTMRINLL